MVCIQSSVVARANSKIRVTVQVAQNKVGALYGTAEIARFSSVRSSLIIIQEVT